jgi:hypothetical protein
MDNQESASQASLSKPKEKTGYYPFNAFSYDSINCVRFEGYKSQSVRTPLKPFLIANVVVLGRIKKS